MDAITLENVTKSYDSVTAVNGVNLRVRQGAILGLLGPNGAGKTTTIRMIMNILVPDDGSIKVLDQPVNDCTRDLIGYLPEERGLYPRMKVRDVIIFLAALHGRTEEEAGRRATEWLDRLGLAEWSGKKLVDLSKGMQQKVQFITAVIHKPPLVILDEPFSGLDVTTVMIVRSPVQELARRGKVVLFSSHEMETVERVCSRIVILHKGRVVANDSIEQLRALMSLPTLEEIFSQLAIEQDTHAISEQMVQLMEL